MATLLIIDDDREMSGMLVEYLEAEGFQAEIVTDGLAGLEQALSGSYALAILDVMLPGMNGMEVLRRLRLESSLPVLMLTARGEAVDRVRGLEIGADDYLGKPFLPQELVARVKAVLRRAAPLESAKGAAPATLVGDLRLDHGARMVEVAGRPVNLTATEFTLLEALVRQAGAVVAREELHRSVLGREFSVYDRGIDNHVSMLRRKLGPFESGQDRIQSVRAVGYIYRLSGNRGKP